MMCISVWYQIIVYVSQSPPPNSEIWFMDTLDFTYEAT